MTPGVPYPKSDQTKRPTKPITKPTKRRQRLTSAERAAYAEATERARCAEGYIRCESCSIPLRDHQAQRHHVIYRSQGGPTLASNLAVLCRRCHEAVHSHRSDYLSRPTLHGTYSTAVNA